MRDLLPASCRSARLPVALVALVLLGAAPATQAANYWFETYERAVELIEDGRHEEAQPLLTAVLQNHPVPQPQVRVPGNRYTIYAPYLQQARIHFLRGDYLRAAKSLDVSEAFGEASRSRRHMAQLQDLREQLRDKELRGEFSYDEPATLTVEQKTAD